MRDGPRALGVSRAFSNDALAYFTERLEVSRLRQALRDLVQKAKRRKVSKTSSASGSRPSGFTRPPAAETHLFATWLSGVHGS